VRAVVQRIESASVKVGGETVGACRRGLLVLVGVGHDDTAETAERLAARVARLRIFENDERRFDRSLLDVAGAALVVSQFTLFGDSQKGTRPDFSKAARPEIAEPLYERFCVALRDLGVPVETGVFGERMQVELVNDGPVTIILDS
jgi:D-tyrosyl-tRNA(Tyr) deacylase